MRVLHVSTSDCKGGAARAAWNLVEGLRRARIDARMLVRDKHSEAAHVQVAPEYKEQGPALEHSGSLVQRKLVNPSRTALSNTWFSLAVPGCDISQNPEVVAADVIHLHWVSGFLTPASIGLLQAAGKPLVWTLHDQRPFTGGCHFSAGCHGFEEGCSTCPQLKPACWAIPPASLHEALRSMEAAQVRLIAPSRWMAACAKRSTVFRASECDAIPYGVDTEIFQKRSSIRNRMGVSEDALLLLAGADQSNEFRKGLHLLSQVVREIRKTGANAEVAVFGAENPPEGFACPARWLGRIESQRELSEVYSSADAFVLPSLEDNLPNTMLEALCCGTPVLAFAAGGVPDAVEHGRNGLLSAELSPRGLLEILKEFIATPGKLDRQEIATRARTRFSLLEQAKSCSHVYAQLLENTDTHPVARGNRELISAEFRREFESWVRQANRQRWKNRWLKLTARLSIGKTTAPGAKP